MVEPPVKPVILEHEHFLQLLSCQWAGDRLAFEVPGAASLGVDQLKATAVRLLKEFQAPSINRSLKRTHRSTILTQRNYDRRRSDDIDDRALLLQHRQRIRN